MTQKAALIAIDARGASTQGRGNAVNGDSWIADLDAGVFAVCDGVSGQTNPALASETTVRTLSEVAKRDVGSKSSPSDLATLLESAIQDANQRIWKLGTGTPQSRPATTATAVLVRGNSAALAHVGDSRAYLVRGGSVRVLTDDHSYGAEQVRKGAVTPENVKKIPHTNALTRALGAQEYVQCDLLQVELSAGDVLILTSDGVHEALGDSAFEKAAIAAATDLDATGLVSAAVQASGRDDATAVLLRFRGGESRPEEVSSRQKMDILSKLALFQYLGTAELLKVLELAKKLEVPVGSTVIQEGSQGSDMYVVISGSLEVIKGGAPITRRGAGEMVGEMSMLDGAPRFASVRAGERSVLLRILRDPLFDLMKRDPTLAVKLLWGLCGIQNERLKVQTQELMDHKAVSPPPLPTPFSPPKKPSA